MIYGIFLDWGVLESLRCKFEPQNHDFGFRFKIKVGLGV